MKPIEVAAKRVNMNIDDTKKQMASLIKSEIKLSAQNDAIYTRVIVFGVISISLMSISTYMQVKYLKNFFRYKKII